MFLDLTEYFNLTEDPYKEFDLVNYMPKQNNYNYSWDLGIVLQLILEARNQMKEIQRKVK